MRSGNHAIVGWLQGLYPNSSICFLNNLRHGDYDPFRHSDQTELIGIDESLDREALREINKDVLIYSYEDRKSLEEDNIDFVSSVFNEDFERNRETYLGKSEHRFDVFIIRDPFNCLASRLVLLRERGALGGLDDLSLIKDNWKVVAKKVLQMQQDGGSHEIAISYNAWIIDSSYQAKISERLMGQFSSPSLDKISRYGGGSSFGRTNVKRLSVEHLIKNMHKVFSFKRWRRFKEYLARLFVRSNRPEIFSTRWQKLSNDEEYRAQFADPEIIELSERIFGEIPGTREFVNEVCRNV